MQDVGYTHLTHKNCRNIYTFLSLLMPFSYIRTFYLAALVTETLEPCHI